MQLLWDANKFPLWANKVHQHRPTVEGHEWKIIWKTIESNVKVVRASPLFSPSGVRVDIRHTDKTLACSPLISLLARWPWWWSRNLLGKEKEVIQRHTSAWSVYLKSTVLEWTSADTRRLLAPCCCAAERIGTTDWRKERSFTAVERDAKKKSRPSD